MAKPKSARGDDIKDDPHDTDGRADDEDGGSSSDDDSQASQNSQNDNDDADETVKSSETSASKSSHTALHQKNDSDDSTSKGGSLDDEDAPTTENDKEESAGSTSNDDEPEEEEVPMMPPKPIRKRTRSKNRRQKDKRSEMEKLVPGYRAPMKLSCDALDRIRPAGISAMMEQAKWHDAANQKGMMQAKLVAQQSRQKNGGMNPAFTASYGSVTTVQKRRKKATQAQAAKSFGQGWFHMAATPMTEEIQQDLLLIRNRNYLDPKKFYKSADIGSGAKVQVGTVVEGPTEYYSSRLTKKQRRSNLVDEIMADPSSSDYAKKKYKRMQQANTEKGKKWKKKNPNSSAKSFKAIK